MTIRIGILGAGSISDTHARAALAIPGVEIAAVYGRNVEKARQLAERYGGVAFDSLERFLDHRPMDLVAIGSPSALHAEQGIAAAERGLHVLVEKPLDISARQSRRPHRRDGLRGRQAGRVLPGPSQARRGQVEGHARRWSGRAADLASGRVSGTARRNTTAAPDGAARSSSTAAGPSSTRRSMLDLILHLWGPIVQRRRAGGDALHAIEVEDTVVATLQFANGALGVFEASTAVFPGTGGASS